jgi:hypothetical protein
MRGLLTAYRRTGADLPYGDPRRAHGTAFEGWYWRITDAETGTVVVALCGLSRDGGGTPWGTVGLAAHRPGDPDRFVRSAIADGGGAAGHAVQLGDAGRSRAHATPWGLALDVAGHAQPSRLRIHFDDPVAWPARRPLGGVGLGHLVPGLSQYWHPHLLGARVHGHAILDGDRVALDGATAYAEKNWGAGFPRDWWWGQAHGFERADVCVAFAGGEVRYGPVRTHATALVVRVGGELVRLGEPLLAPVRHELAPGRWALSGRNRAGDAVELTGEADPSSAHDLPVPVPRERRHVPGARQHLAGTVEVRVRRRGRLLFAGRSALAGLERGTVVSSGALWTSQTRSGTSSSARSQRTSAPAM